MFTTTKDYELQLPTSQYFAGQMITQEWVQPGNKEHRTFPSVSDIQDAAGHTLVTSYAVLRPDGEWSVMMVNKDQWNAHSVQLVFGDEKSKKDRNFAGPVSVVTFGSEQYQWHSNIKGGIADPDGPPARATITATTATLLNLSESVGHGHSRKTVDGQREVENKTAWNDVRAEILTQAQSKSVSRMPL